MDKIAHLMKNSGFSILELIIAMALTSGLMLAAGEFMLNIVKHADALRNNQTRSAFMASKLLSEPIHFAEEVNFQDLIPPEQGGGYRTYMARINGTDTNGIFKVTGTPGNERDDTWRVVTFVPSANGFYFYDKVNTALAGEYDEPALSATASCAAGDLCTTCSACQPLLVPNLPVASASFQDPNVRALPLLPNRDVKFVQADYTTAAPPAPDNKLFLPARSIRWGMAVGQKTTS